MLKQVEDLLGMYRNKLETVSQHHIVKVILFGSYARGDFKEDSDIDILILVDLKDFKECEEKIFDLTYDFNLEHDTEIMPIIQNVEHFDYWKNAYMFYRNISREGVAI